jgi:hypothetical protein
MITVSAARNLACPGSVLMLPRNSDCPRSAGCRSGGEVRPEEAAMELRVGDKIWTRTLGVVRHYGVYVGRRGPSGEDVVHNSKIKGGVVLEHLNVFSDGNPVLIEKRAAPGYEWYVAERALSYRGQNYDLLNFNCEHLASLVHEGQKSSPQLRSAGVAAAVVSAIAAAFALAPNGTYDGYVDRYRDRNGRFVRR